MPCWISAGVRLSRLSKIAGEIVGRPHRENINRLDGRIGVRLFETIVFLGVLVVLYRQPPFEKRVVDGFVGGQIRRGNLAQLAQRFFDEDLLRFVALVRVVVEQMIVTFDAVVNGVGGMEIEILFEIAGRKIRRT